MSRVRNAWRILIGRYPMAQRRVLPDRRDVETVKFEFGDHKWFGSLGRFADGSPAEVFMKSAKTGNLMRAMTNDSAIAASLALQYGCPAHVLIGALTRDMGGEPLSPLSAALDILTTRPEEQCR